MENALALVHAYLHILGFDTVNIGIPVKNQLSVEAVALTDIDILATRTQKCGTFVDAPGHDEHASYPLEQHTVSQLPRAWTDVLVGEIQQGPAGLRRGTVNPATLKALLERFGCQNGQIEKSVHQLLHDGTLETATRRIQLVLFGTDPAAKSAHVFISLIDVAAYVQEYIRQNWETVSQIQFQDPILGMLVNIEKSTHLDTPARTHLS